MSVALPDSPGKVDAFLGGRLHLAQMPTGHRAGTDAILLAACIPDEAQGTAVDVGAGVGAAGLTALMRASALNTVLVEIDAATAALAQDNIARNDLSGRARAVTADVLVAASRRAAGLVDGTAQIVLTNPPFFDSATTRPSPDADRARAHAMDGGIDLWLKASLALLAPGGLFAMIHRAEALGEILVGLGQRLGNVSIRPVHARADAPAIRVLITGIKGSRAPLSLLPPLILHGPDGRFTVQAEAIHRGEMGLESQPPRA